MAYLRKVLTRLKSLFSTGLTRTTDTDGDPVVLLGQGGGRRAYVPTQETTVD